MYIPEIKLAVSAETDEAKAAVGFKYADGEIGARSKLGGSPDWIQPALDVQCDYCRIPMTFYAQIDSVGDKVMLADCGMVYVFVCFDCYESKAVVQSY